MKTVFEPAVRKELIERVSKLTPHSKTVFGKMRPDQGLHHINGALQLYIRELSAPFHGNNFKAALMRLFTFSPIPIPREKAQTPPVLVSDGTYNIESEKSRFSELIERVAAQKNETDWPISPVFGKLSADKYGKLAYKHTDHHLQQFGV